MMTFSAPFAKIDCTIEIQSNRTLLTTYTQALQQNQSRNFQYASFKPKFILPPLSYTYDAAGNVLKLKQNLNSGTKTTVYIYNTANELVTTQHDDTT